MAVEFVEEKDLFRVLRQALIDKNIVSIGYDEFTDVTLTLEDGSKVTFVGNGHSLEVKLSAFVTYKGEL